MVRLEFVDLKFQEEVNQVKVNFYRNYYFYIDKESLKSIGKFKINNNSIEFSGASEGYARKRFDHILSEGFDNLKNQLNNKRTIYIHQNSGIPLIGSIYFGIVDRGTNIIELRPSTGCNLNCTYCSVDEGKGSKKQVDYVVELEYLLNEFKALAEIKKCDIEAHINTQGEPLLYPRLVELVKSLSSIKSVKTISMDTNGTLLTKDVVDKLTDAGLTRFNLSLNAIDEKIAGKMAGMPYNSKKVMKIAEYILKKTDLIIAPIWLPGYNDDEIPKIIEFAVKIWEGKSAPKIGIQNFLDYKFGRNPVKSMSFDTFYKKLKELEVEYNIRLISSPEDFNIKQAASLPIPFKKGEITKAKVICPGRLRNEMLAVAKGRVISIPNCDKAEGVVKIRITRTKHNIFIGVIT